MLRFYVYVIFFVSGMLALGYQSIWSRYLGHLLGHAALAQTLAVSAFMLGLGIGSWYAGKRSNMSARHALMGYVIVELGIALWGLLFHPSYLALESRTSGSALLQYLLALLLITPPAAAMGATFPLFWRGMTKSGLLAEASALPALYFTNAFGGAVGALATTFVIVPQFGLPGSLTVFWIGNIALALFVALLFLRKSANNVESLESEHTNHPAPAASFATFATIAAITGATSLVYQVIWFRMVALSLGSSQHSFEIVLAAFIFSLAMGALMLSRIDKFAQSTIAWASCAQIAMGCFAILSFAFWYLQFPWVANIVSTLSPTALGYKLFLVFSFIISLLLVFPTAFWAGMTLPLLTRSALGYGPTSVGYIYAWNTVGCMIGALIATHLLISNIGIKLTILIAGLADIVLGLYLLGLLPKTKARAKWFAVAAASSLVSIFLVQMLKEDRAVVTSGVFRHGQLADAAKDVTIKYYRDGKTATINTSSRGDSSLSVVTNGKVDGSISLTEQPTADEYTMVITGVLASIYHANPAQAMIVGFGTGVSTHSMLGDRRLAEVTTVEIEPAVVDAASFLSAQNIRAYTDPRSKVVYNDAKSFMKLDKRQWDIVVSEPSNPWVGGVANLFSKEFYGSVKKKLKPDGVFVQWLQVYETNDAIVASALLALNEHFPNFRVFDIGQNDWIIVARPDGEFLLNDSIFASPDIAASLKRIGILTPADLLVRMVGTEKEFIPVAQALGAPANSDFSPYLFVNAPGARFERKAPVIFSALSEGDLQRVGLASAGVESVDTAQDHAKQGVAIVGLRERRKTEALVADAMAKAGEYEFHPEFGKAATILSRLSTCDLRVQPRLFNSLDRIIPLIMSPISYPALESLLEQSANCEQISPEFKLVLEFMVNYSKRKYQAMNEKAAEVLAVKGASPLTSLFLRQLAISAALITKDCNLAKQLDTETLDIARKALIGACKAG